VALDVDAMPWEPLGPAGLYSKLLSRDPDTGARTALQRLCPQEEYQSPQVAHFHNTYEEILGVRGRFSFDSRRWITPGSYVFHPPRTVHGFKSAVPTESWFLSRVGRPLDVNLVHEPSADDIYLVDGDAAPLSRPPAAYANPMDVLPWVRRPFLGSPVEWCALSADSETGEGSALARLPAGWASEPRVADHYLELFVLEGGVGVDGGPDADGHHYFFYPQGEMIGRLGSARGALAYVNFGGHLGEA
jgi:hypothetical protein